MQDPQYIVAPELCTGCSLCANVCSQNAITMGWNAEGFLTPRVNTDACINCGLCSKLCPAKQPEEAHQDELRRQLPAYGAWSTDAKTHLKSSSGGVFSVLSEVILRDGGCVFGVVWQDKQTAVFAKAETMDEVAAMRGSKYTMAIPGTVYRDVKTELLKGRRVLFSGTPCQVQALKAYLRKPYDRLVTFDIVCHGVPSRHLLNKYVSEAEERTGKTVARIDFRAKRDCWLRFNQIKTFTDGSEEVSYLLEDPYMRLFLMDVTLNRCCYNCRYAHFPRQGDLSLGDFWGIQHIHPEWPIEQGISVLLVNTEQGRKFLSCLNEEKITLNRVPFSAVYKGQKEVYMRPVREIPQERERFMRECATTALEELVITCKPLKKKLPFRKKLIRELQRPFRQLRRLIMGDDD